MYNRSLIPADQVLWEAVRRNATHGLQLSRADKQRLGPAFYTQGRSIEEIAAVLSVSERALQGWTKDIRDQEKEERNEQIWQLWLRCWTEGEIAKEILQDETKQNTVSIIIKKRKLAEIATPSSLQIFNVWHFQDNDPADGTDKYPGRILIPICVPPPPPRGDRKASRPPQSSNPSFRTSSSGSRTTRTTSRTCP